MNYNQNDIRGELVSAGFTCQEKLPPKLEEFWDKEVPIPDTDGTFMIGFGRFDENWVMSLSMPLLRVKFVNFAIMDVSLTNSFSVKEAELLAYAIIGRLNR